MKVIGAGLPRTATTTQLIVLEQLGFGPCYHMRDVLGDLAGQLPAWERAVDGDADWEAILGDAQSCCDFPTSRYYRELAEYYPDAKVILTERSPESWVRSMRETIWPIFFGDSTMRHINAARVTVDSEWDRYLKMMTKINFAPETGAMVGADTASDEEFGAMMTRWNDGVKASVAPERLLVWNPAEGWDRLCEFLEVPVPDGAVPHVNDISAFTEGILGGGLAVLNAWWDSRDRPESGLHGAEL